MQRTIGKFETAPAVANEFACFNLVGILELENGPRPEVVQDSLNILQNHHPVLRSRILKKGNSYFFDEIEGHTIPVTVAERPDPDHWISYVESYLNHSLDWETGPLLNCTYLYNEARGGVSEIIFAFHHSIIDAISLVTFFDDFLTLCASLPAGGPIKGYGGYPALPAVEKLFPPSHKGIGLAFRTLRFMARQMYSELTIMRRTNSRLKPPIHIDSTGRVLTMHLSEDETAALEKKARIHKVTLNSIQHAAILTATWKHLYKSEAVPMKYILFQNLRPYLMPPLDEMVMGSYIAMIQLATFMDLKKDFWDLCHEINHSVYLTGKSGDKFVSANMSGSLLKMLFRFKSFRMAVTAMNYSGAIPLQQTYGDIGVVGIRGFASNFGLGPEFSAQTLMFNGKLYWNIVYLETDMDEETAQTITNEIKSILVSKAAE